MGLRYALVTHQVIFMCILFLGLTKRMQFFPQSLNLCLLTIQGLQFQTKQPLYHRIIQFIPFRYGGGKSLDRLFHITLPKTLSRPTILQFRLALFDTFLY